MSAPAVAAARLHVILAREAPVALVIRRGPSKLVCALLWDLRTDEIRLGQWLRGRIYERRCDLSPDGRHWIYFALAPSTRPERRDAPYAYTAVARPPYLTAVALYPQDHTWLGGGLFTGNHSYWLNTGCTEAVRESGAVHCDTAYEPCREYGAECRSVYYVRLQRDGWRYLNPERFNRGGSTDLFERPLPHGFTLHKIATCGPYADAHEIIHYGRGEIVEHPDWEWAEWDGQRLLWAAGGRLWSGEVDESGLVRPRLIHDFNPMQFEPRVAPYAVSRSRSRR